MRSPDLLPFAVCERVIELRPARKLGGALITQPLAKAPRPDCAPTGGLVRTFVIIFEMLKHTHALTFGQSDTHKFAYTLALLTLAAADRLGS